MSEAKRREVWAVHDGSNYLRFKSEAAAKETSKLYGRAVILFREVLPGDPDPEAVRDLVEVVCEVSAIELLAIAECRALGVEPDTRMCEKLRAALAKMKEPPRG